VIRIVSKEHRHERANRYSCLSPEHRGRGPSSKPQGAIALNRLAEKSGWNQELLALEFRKLLALDLTLDLDFALTVTGFASPEIDQLIESQEQASDADPDDLVPDDIAGSPVSRLGDLWLLGEHCLICGDARDEYTYAPAPGMSALPWASMTSLMT
jgi:hypothetical protein